MKKANKINPQKHDDGMLPEYDFAGKKGVRGKYYQRMQQGYTVRVHNEDGTITTKHHGPTIILEPDVAVYFPDSESVNNALRTLIALVPNKQIGDRKPVYKVRKRTGRKTAARK